jgi:tetratricopeptide (TPR) repeat protein/V8-like Glu-specific endopeptidase
MNSIRLFLAVSLGSTLMLPSPVFNLLPPQNDGKAVAQAVDNLSPEALRNLAASFTVKVLTANNRGSGFIVARNGQVYTVLTSAHVLTPGAPHRIQTPDGKIYSATVVASREKLKNNDLAILQFRATVDYSIASLPKPQRVDIFVPWLPNGELQVQRTPITGEEVYVAGFPFDADQLNMLGSKINLLPDKPLTGGYQIGYVTSTRQGMSGGPVLDQSGEVIGIHGLGNIAILDNAYVFQDGSRPSEQQLQQMQQMSFAVPITTAQQVIPQIATAPSQSGTQTLPKNQPQPQSPAASNFIGIVAKVDHIAQQVTVRIDSLENGNSSGVIIAKDGQTYYVLTAAHVVENLDKYKVTTPNGQQYQVDYKAIKSLKGIDLAIVPFQSPQSYTVAILANYEVSIGQPRPVFTAGMPSLAGKGPKYIFTAGIDFGKFLNNAFIKNSVSLGSGNELAFTNLSYPGMSGGPVFDWMGRVVGINTSSDNEYSRDSASQGSELLIGFSLGVPISAFLGLADKANIQTSQLKVESQAPKQLASEAYDEMFNQFEPSSEPSKTATAEDWLNYGSQLLRVGQGDKAFAAINQALKIKPDFYQAYYFRALAFFFAVNDVPKALGDLEQVTKLRPDFVQAWRYRGILYGNSLNYPEAIDSVDELIRLNPKDHTSYQMKANLQVSMGRIAEALETTNELLRIRSDAPGLTIRCFVYSALGNHENALADCNQSINLDPTFTPAYLNRGLVYANTQKYPQSLTDYNLVLERQPRNSVAYAQRGNTYLLLGENQKALEDFNKSIEIQPEDKLAVPAYTGRGNIYGILEKMQEAYSDFNKAIEINPIWAEAYLGRGLINGLLKNYSKAVADLTKAIELKPPSVGIETMSYAMRGLNYKILGDAEQAQADLTKAEQLSQKLQNPVEIKGVQQVLQTAEKIQVSKNVQVSEKKDEKEITGIGVKIEQDKETKQITVVSLFEDSPAAAAGILPKDVITKIDGKSTVGMSVEQASSLIRGPIDSTVSLTISRSGQALEFNLKRAKIQ